MQQSEVFYCYYCKKAGIRSLKLLKRHLNRVHIRPLQCKDCGLRFGGQYELNRHIDDKRGACKGRQGQFKEVEASVTRFYHRVIACKTIFDLERALYHGDPSQGKKIYDANSKGDIPDSLSHDYRGGCEPDYHDGGNDECSSDPCLGATLTEPAVFFPSVQSVDGAQHIADIQDPDMGRAGAFRPGTSMGLETLPVWNYGGFEHLTRADVDVGMFAHVGSEQHGANSMSSGQHRYNYGPSGDFDSIFGPLDECAPL